MNLVYEELISIIDILEISKKIENKKKIIFMEGENGLGKTFFCKRISQVFWEKKSFSDDQQIEFVFYIPLKELYSYKKTVDSFYQFVFQEIINSKTERYLTIKMLKDKELKGKFFFSFFCFIIFFVFSFY